MGNELILALTKIRHLLSEDTITISGDGRFTRSDIMRTEAG